MFLKVARTILSVLIRIIQKIFLSVCLIIIYFLGVGLTALIMAVFNRSILIGHSKADSTFWIKSNKDGSDMDDGTFQS